MRRYAPIAESLVVLAVTLPLAVGLHWPTVWLLVPLLVLTLSKRPFEPYGLTWANPGPVGFHLRVCAAIFVPYLIGHFLFARWWLGASFRFMLPNDFAWSIVEQFLAIGLPEEFFFRGYLQTNCDRVFGTPWRLAGARVGYGFVFAAAIFAVCHVVNGGPARLIVFFPGLLYGWLRNRTDTIAVPAAYHAVSNLLMATMLASLSTVQ